MKYLLALAFGFVGSFAAGAGYAQQDFSKTDPIEIANFLCMAEVKLTKAQEQADKLNNHFKDGTPLSQVALHEASYLPAGFPQTNPGYDSCMLTGVGYYFDMDNKRQFNNCDPQAPRYFEVDCRNITARIVDLEDERGGRSGNGAGVTGNYKVMPFDPRTTNVCPDGMGRSARVNGREDEEEKVIYQTPKCENILSTFKLDDHYLACDNASVTYNTCHASLSGTYSHRRDYTTTGSFCAIPQGTKAINHVDIFNARKAGELKTTASNLSKDLPGKLRNVQGMIQKHQIICDSKGQATSVAGVRVR